jgi:hypothetical protein
MRFRIITAKPIPLAECSKVFAGMSNLYRGYAVALDTTYYRDFTSNIGPPTCPAIPGMKHLRELGRQGLLARVPTLFDGQPLVYPLSLFKALDELKDEPVLKELSIGTLEGTIANIIKIIFRPFRKALILVNEHLGVPESQGRGHELPGAIAFARDVIDILKTEGLNADTASAQLGAGLAIIGAITMYDGLEALNASHIDIMETADDPHIP